jgi:cyclophilin family peptidyl-prolyl cis-trans isomerase
MIQTGDPNTKGTVDKDFVYDPQKNPNNLPIAGTGGPGYKFEDEFNGDLKFDKPGVLAMANSGANTNGSQIFITHLETPWLNGKHTIFGRVVSGQNIVNSIKQGDEIKDIIIEK